MTTLSPTHHFEVNYEVLGRIVVGNKENTISRYAIFDNLKTVDINVYRLSVAESWGLDNFKI